MFLNRTEEKIFSFLLLGDFKENLSLLVSARPASFCPPAKRLVIKAVLVPDQSAVCKLDLQYVEDKYSN